MQGAFPMKRLPGAKHVLVRVNVSGIHGLSVNEGVSSEGKEQKLEPAGQTVSSITVGGFMGAGINVARVM